MSQSFRFGFARQSRIGEIFRFFMFFFEGFGHFCQSETEIAVLSGYQDYVARPFRQPDARIGRVQWLQNSVARRYPMPRVEDVKMPEQRSRNVGREQQPETDRAELQQYGYAYDAVHGFVAAHPIHHLRPQHYIYSGADGDSLPLEPA